MRISVWVSPLGLLAVAVVCIYACVLEIVPRFGRGIDTDDQNRECRITAHLFGSGIKTSNCVIHLDKD
jgi:hypothetical protein